MDWPGTTIQSQCASSVCDCGHYRSGQRKQHSVLVWSLASRVLYWKANSSCVCCHTTQDPQHSDCSWSPWWWSMNTGYTKGVGGLSWQGIAEFLQLWDCLMEITLSNQEDHHIWRLEGSGIYSSKSAYKVFLQWVTHLWAVETPLEILGSAQMQIFFLWLAIRKQCWTADKLAKRGLPHPEKCPLCDQEEETVQHLLTTCVVARQVWFEVFSPLNLSGLVPQLVDSNVATWWRRALNKVTKEHKKGVNSLIILVAWSIWKHRNACVFEYTSPSVASILRELKDEHSLWCMAGPKKLEELGLAGGF